MARAIAGVGRAHDVVGAGRSGNLVPDRDGGSLSLVMLVVMGVLVIYGLAVQCGCDVGAVAVFARGPHERVADQGRAR